MIYIYIYLSMEETESSLCIKDDMIGGTAKSSSQLMSFFFSEKKTHLVSRFYCFEKTLRKK